MVPQDTVLFNDTIAYNIRYGRPSPPTRKSRRGGSRPDRPLHRRTCRTASRPRSRTRAEALGRGEAARGDRPNGTEGAADPHPRARQRRRSTHHQREEIQTALDVVSRTARPWSSPTGSPTVIGADEIIVLKGGEIAEREPTASCWHERALCSMWNRQREATQAGNICARSARATRHGRRRPRTPAVLTAISLRSRARLPHGDADAVAPGVLRPLERLVGLVRASQRVPRQRIELGDAMLSVPVVSSTPERGGIRHLPAHGFGNLRACIRARPETAHKTPRRRLVPP